MNKNIRIWVRKWRRARCVYCRRVRFLWQLRACPMHPDLNACKCGSILFERTK